MKAFESLPEGYGEILSINLQKDKKLAVVINLLSLLICAVMFAVMLFFVPINVVLEGDLVGLIIKMAVLIVGFIAYIVLHELVHGVAMKICGTKKVKFGFTGLYAFAGSDDYYDKKSYIFIALAPVVLWGVVLAVINALVPLDWFWIVYFIQVMNISGAIGDFYVTVKFSRLPENILICDSGIGMKVFSEKSDMH